MFQLSERKWLLFSLFCVVIVIALVSSYFLIFPPLKKQLEQLEANLKTEEKLLALVLEQQKEQKEPFSDYQWQQLQCEVPVYPLVDQFIFDLEKAEVFSDSFIVNYSFSEGTFSGIGIKGETSSTEAETVDSTNNAIIAQDNSESGRITVNMSVITPHYDNLLEFLRRIESLDRTTKIDQISFTGNQEVVFLDTDEEEQQLNFSLSVSTFYLPELAAYAEYAPKLEYPQHSKRYDPLYYNLEEGKENEAY